MIGVTITHIEGAIGDGRLAFHTHDGRTFVLQHNQDCCENVSIEDIAGDLSDLVGSPIVEAEEVSNADEPPAPANAESYTWTFYKFGTRKGSVTVRWFGESNGYYSESVDFSIDAPPACVEHEDCRATYALGRACFLATGPA